MDTPTNTATSSTSTLVDNALNKYSLFPPKRTRSHSNAPSIVSSRSVTPVLSPAPSTDAVATPTSTPTFSTSTLVDTVNNAFDRYSLFPPRRTRSHSNAPSIVSSRSLTPVPSPAPSTPHLSTILVPDIELPNTAIDLPAILDSYPIIVDHLDARDILSLSRATRHCATLRTPETFNRHLTLNGWDTAALARRTERTKHSKGRPWMFLAKSAVQKDDILSLYQLLPKIDAKKTFLKDKKKSLAVKRFLRILMDVVTEHDQHNFSKLTDLADSIHMSFIQFLAAIPAHDWKARYRKTFIIAAYTNSQPVCPDGANDLEAFSETLSFEDPNPQLLLLSARANLLYTFACMSYSKVSPHPLHSSHYDEPHLLSRGSTLPGLRQAVDRFTNRIALRGFYRRATGGISPMQIAFEPVGLASKTRLPFTEKDLLTLEATVTQADDDKTPPWQISGSIDRNTGVGKLKTASGMVYEVWVTPWGLTGQKIRGEGKHLGYFVLQWP